MENTISTRQIFRDDFLLLSIFYYNALCAVFEASLQRTGCGTHFVAVCLSHVGLLYALQAVEIQAYT